MKMNVVDDLVIRSEPTYTETDPTPDVIGLEFVRQYYTILSKQPGNVHKFYSHESVFVHNDVTVVGQQGSFTSNKGIVLQVCGEVSTRRFFQTFILAQQSAKKFYVQNDIFQFVDVAFHCESQDSPAPPASSESAVAEVQIRFVSVLILLLRLFEKSVGISAQLRKILVYKKILILFRALVTFIFVFFSCAQSVEIDLVQNGHNHSHSSIALSCEETPAMTSVVSHAKVAPVKNPTIPSTEEISIKESPPVENTLKSKVEQTNLETTVPLSADNTPKTWAHRVGGGPKSPAAPSAALSGQKSSATNNASGPAATRVQQVTRPHVQTNEFGEVESVAIPRKVLDQPNDTSRNGFAFISMRTAVDAQNVFQKARKDDRGTYHLQLRLDAFGFDGEVTISEQKDRMDRPSGGFRGNRSGFISRGGASSFSRSGGRGRGGGGGFRGGFHNQSNH
ncbi:unnamed protein product [Angiostrongylus costaricensis]|uniref:NTF2 domain-containing protein n=1 Tax=Angiostrongylus costaricensis TaxID=334426 RepID=A0A158PL88_ANGCS|nr:unnamed protein product [Angiostrongylus costaricensis]